MLLLLIIGLIFRHWINLWRVYWASWKMVYFVSEGVVKIRKLQSKNAYIYIYRLDIYKMRCTYLLHSYILKYTFLTKKFLRFAHLPEKIL